MSKKFPDRALVGGAGNAMGHRKVLLYNDAGKPKGVWAHRAVLLAWVGPPEPGQVARHLNGDPADNRLENLVWGSVAENHHDRIAHGTSQHGEQNPRATLTRNQVDQMRDMYAQGGWTYKSLAVEFGVFWTTVAGIITRRTWFQ